MMSKKTKIMSFFIFLVILFVAFTYRYSSKRIEYYGYYDKVWAHRVNDLKKLESSQEKFKGFELDLVYQEKGDWLDIFHSPSPSKGLSFTSYTKHITNKSAGLWLDLKNLNQKNYKAFFKLIDSTVASAELKRDNIIVESSSPEFLTIFHEKGYRTSYYLPAKIYLKTEKEIRKDIKEIKMNIANNPQLELSAYFEDYPIVAKYFPLRKKNFWVLHSTYSPKILIDYKKLRKMLKDSTVKTVLTPYNNFNKIFKN